MTVGAGAPAGIAAGERAAGPRGVVEEQPAAGADGAGQNGPTPVEAGASAASDGGQVAPSSGRRRQRQSERRPHRLTLRLSGEELEVVSGAAALAGLTPTGYVAKVAVDVASARVRPVPTAVADAIGELLTARYQVQKFSALVNQAVAKWHAAGDLGELPPQLLGAVALVGRVLPRLEEAASAVRASQHDAGRRRLLAPRAGRLEPAGAPSAAGGLV